MQEKYIRYLLVIMFSISLVSIFRALVSPSSEKGDQYQVNVTQMVTADAGLDLRAVGELLKKSQSPKEFEQLLNDKKSGVNNLDLNQDGKVDYIKVTEFGDDKIKGFSLTAEPSPGEVQEVATIKIEKNGDDKATVEYQGNPQIYGQNHYYQSSWGGMGSGFLMGYLFSNMLRPPYMSPYSYGNYPPNYQQHRTVPHGEYQKRNAQTVPKGAYARSSTGRFDHVTSPNRGKSSSMVKAPLKNPTSSQKAFRAKNSKMTRKVKKGGFGRKRSLFSPRKSAPRRRMGGFGRRRR